MSEWRTPDLLSLPFLPVFAGILGVVWLAQRGRLEGKDWLLLVPFLALAVSANRSVPPAWIGLAPILGRVEIPIRATLAGGPVAAVLALAFAVTPLFARADEPIDEHRFPTEAADHLSTDRVFHDDAAGGWLVYTQWPDRQNYIDDRAELFGPQMRTFADVRAGRADWHEEFAKWSIDEALLSVEEPLVDDLEAAGWVTTYDDEEFVILRRPE